MQRLRRRRLLWIVLLLTQLGGARPNALQPYVDHDALSKEKLVTSHHVNAKIIASCYPNLQLTSQAELKGHAGETLYGEITFASLHKFLTTLEAGELDSFYDLGSGTGKTVLQAALHGLRSSTGVELVKERHEVAVAALQQFNLDQSRALKNSVDFQLGSMFNLDLSSATVVYVNSLAMGPQTLTRLSEKLKELPGGAVVATLKPIGGDHLLPESSLQLQMTFGSGPSEVILYTRAGRTRRSLLRKLRREAFATV